MVNGILCAGPESSTSFSSSFFRLIARLLRTYRVDFSSVFSSQFLEFPSEHPHTVLLLNKETPQTVQSLQVGGELQTQTLLLQSRLHLEHLKETGGAEQNKSAESHPVHYEINIHSLQRQV